MKSFGKIIFGMAIVSSISAIPAFAAITNQLDFQTSFPFYVGNVEMPAGSYSVAQPDMDGKILLIRNADRAHSAFIDFIPTHAAQPHAHSDVTFHKYENVEYLNRLWVDGQQYGMKVEPTKAEQNLAAQTKPVEHSLVADKR